MDYTLTTQKIPYAKTMRCGVIAIILGLLSLSGSAYAERDNPLDVHYQKASHEFVIITPESRELPPYTESPATSAPTNNPPVKLTNNVHMDASLLGRPSNRFIPVPIKAEPTKPAQFHSALCHPGFEDDGLDYVVCFQQSQTQLDQHTMDDLRTIAANDGYFHITTYAYSPGDQNEQVAAQRNRAIVSLFENAGVEKDWILNETDIEDGCSRNCKNQTVVTYQPFK